MRKLFLLCALFNVGYLCAADKIVWVDGVKYAIFCSSNKAQVCSENYTLTTAVIQDSVAYDEWTKYPVTTICDNAFEGSTQLQSVVIGNRVTTIYQKAFYNCENLKSVTIGDNVKTIGKEAFAYCSQLEQINTPNSIETFADDAFLECHNLPVTNNIRYADKFLVEASNKRSSVYSIANNTTIKQDTRWIGKEAFLGALFRNPDLIIPDNVESIGESAFRGGDYESVILGESVCQINKQAFVGRIAGETTYLKTFRVKATTPPQITTDIFEFPAIPDVYVPCGTLETYLQSRWGEIKFYGEQKVMYRPYKLNCDYDIEEGYVNVIGEPAPNECAPELTVEAIAREGYEFDEWSDGNQENPRTIVFDDSMDGIIIKPIFKPISEGVEQIHAVANHTGSSKLLHDGELYILRDNHLFNAQGSRIK